jgi:hypothetical protein
VLDRKWERSQSGQKPDRRDKDLRNLGL